MAVDGMTSLRRSFTELWRSRYGRGSLGVLTALILTFHQAAPARAPDIFFVPTRQVIADAMLTLARVVPGDVVFDLGSGDGRIVILAAQKYRAAGVGIEIDPRLVQTSREVAREGAVDDRVAFIEGDLFTADISQATVVTLYLNRNTNLRLEAKLRKELRSGTRIVSHQFPIGRWQPDETIVVEGEELFLWTVP
jgi:SAM-dependent methyltransferase